jgi:uncharacterized membrane protein YfcA
VGPGTAVAVAGIGAGVGFLSGLFGKGGSAVATPLLNAAGIPAIAAVASPLPATIPTTIAAAIAYWREGMLDRRIVGWTLVFGLPATVAGAITTRWVEGSVLVLITDILITLLGFRVLWSISRPVERAADARPSLVPIAAIALGVGFSAGLLANSGGALLAPLYLTVLHLPIKRTFACSLTAAAALAVPATIIHAALGHIDWAVVAVFSVASVPLSLVGARMALRTSSARLERSYGVVLTGLGIGFLVKGLL